VASTARHHILQFTLAFSLFVSTGTAVAFDLGGMLNQVEQAVHQQEKAKSTSEQQVGPSPSDLENKPSGHSPSFRKPGQSMQDFLNENQEKKVAAEKDGHRQTANALTSDFVETSRPIELKGIKTGMTVAELLKLHPQGMVVNTRPNTPEWIHGDTIVTFTDNRAYCGHGEKTDCRPITVMQKEAVTAGMYFLNGKLTYSEIMFDRDSVKPTDSVLAEDHKHYFNEVIEGLTAKFGVEPKSKETIKDRMAGSKFRIAAWRNTTCQCGLILLEDAQFTAYENNYVLLKLTSDEHSNVAKEREIAIQEMNARAGDEHEAKRISDL